MTRPSICTLKAYLVLIIGKTYYVQWRIQGGGARDVLLVGSILFNFMQFSAKILPNNRSVYPFGIGIPAPWEILNTPLISEEDSSQT